MVRKFEVLETQLANSTIMYRIIPSGTTTEESWGSRVADVWTDAADAKLLAAAPELLETLKRVVGRLKEYEVYESPQLQQGKALINQFEDNQS